MAADRDSMYVMGAIPAAILPGDKRKLFVGVGAMVRLLNRISKRLREYPRVDSSGNRWQISHPRKSHLQSKYPQH
jgi:hypothetical protein